MDFNVIKDIVNNNNNCIICFEHYYQLGVFTYVSCQKKTITRGPFHERFFHRNSNGWKCHPVLIQTVNNRSLRHFAHATNVLENKCIYMFLHSVQGPFMIPTSQWETTLQCNVVSHWLGAFTKWPLVYGLFDTMVTEFAHFPGDFFREANTTAIWCNKALTKRLPFYRLYLQILHKYFNRKFDFHMKFLWSLLLRIKVPIYFMNQYWILEVEHVHRRKYSNFIISSIVSFPLLHFKTS